MDSSRTWSASHLFARIAPRKTRLLIGLIRGMRCDEALEQLRFSPRRSAVLIRDTLRSAMANASEQEAEMPRLYIKEARVDGGPYQRRWRPKDRGRAHPIAKRTSHIHVTVAESWGPGL